MIKILVVENEKGNDVVVVVDTLLSDVSTTFSKTKRKYQKKSGFPNISSG